MIRSSVSFASSTGFHKKCIDDIHCIQNWPGPGRDVEGVWKTPSRIAYADENDGIAVNKWGFQVTPRMKSWTWMKLLLDISASTKYDDPSLAQSEGPGVLSLPHGKTAIDLCADYLSSIAEFAYSEIEKEVSHEILVSSALEFWLTVPAVWSDPARANTLRVVTKAAKDAGVFRDANVSTFVIAEPEAAAVAAISSVSEGASELHFAPGDNILICDCGGGTVNITTYQITALQPLEFKELLVGIGGKCGSTYIDRNFMRWMQERFGHCYSSLTADKIGPGSRFMREFEAHKRDFGTSMNDRDMFLMQLNMPLMQEEHWNYSLEDTEVILLFADMKALFDPVVDMIIDLVQGQVEAAKSMWPPQAIETVILVGGFGDSRYLNDALRGVSRKEGFHLICPKHPQAAIVRGAALSGLQNLQPTSRRSRNSYGFTLGVRYDRRRHNPADVYMDKWEGVEYVRGYMHWSLEKGDLVNQDTHIQQGCWLTVGPKKLRSSAVSTDVYVSSLDDAPTRVENPRVRKLVTMRVDAAKVDLSKCEKKMIDGVEYTRVVLEFKVEFGARRGVLVFTTTINGKEVGVATAKFDSQGSQGADEAEEDGGQVSKGCAVQ